MSETQLYCYACRRSALQIVDQNQTTQPLCPHCSSDFVEVSERPLQGQAEVMLEEQIMHAFDNIAGLKSLHNGQLRFNSPYCLLFNLFFQLSYTPSGFKIQISTFLDSESHTLSLS